MAVLVVAVLEAVAVREPPDAHSALVVPFGPVFEVLAREVAFPNFVLLHFELVDPALIFDVLLGGFGTVAFLALLSPFVAFLLLACCCCLGNDSSYIGLSWVDAGEDGGEVNCEAAVQDVFNYWVHVDDSVADGQTVVLLLAQEEQALDTNLECVEDFGWVLVIASDPDFDGGYFGFERCDGTAGFD